MADFHLLDGMIARGFCQVGLALWISPTFWSKISHKDVRSRTLEFTGLVCSMGGAILSLNAVAISAYSPQGAQDWRMYEELKIAWSGVPAVIAGTFFGKMWTAYIALIGILGPVFWVRRIPKKVHSSLVVVASLVGAATIALMGHAAEQGAFSLGHIVQTTHVLFVAAWLSGIVMIASRRYKRPVQLDRAELARFSAFATWLVPATLLAGSVRLLQVMPVPLGRFFTGQYGLLIVLKIMLVAALLAVASQLRKWVRGENVLSSPSSVQNWTRFDKLFGLEIFLLAILVMLSALLSQLPPY